MYVMLSCSFAVNWICRLPTHPLVTLGLISLSPGTGASSSAQVLSHSSRYPLCRNTAIITATSLRRIHPTNQVFFNTVAGYSDRSNHITLLKEVTFSKFIIILAETRSKYAKNHMSSSAASDFRQEVGIAR